jgi:hypothetical protein
MKKVFLILLFALPITALSTCIVIFKLPDGSVIIAADSKRTFGEDGLPPQTICKIHKSGSCYFAVSGHADSLLTVTVRKMLNSQLPVPQLIKQCADRLKMLYSAMMNNPRFTSAKDVDYYLHNSLAAVAFVYPIQNALVIDCVSFTMSNHYGILEISNTIFENEPSQFLGDARHISDFKSPEMQSLISRHIGDPPVFVKEMVQLAIKYDSVNIGEPIDVLQIKPNGGELWYPSIRSCPGPFFF